MFVHCQGGHGGSEDVKDADTQSIDCWFSALSEPGVGEQCSDWPLETSRQSTKLCE